MNNSSTGTSLIFQNIVFTRPGGFRLSADITFASGLLTVILGPSGSGKTTVLDLAAGFLRPDSGEIFEEKGTEKRNVTFTATEKRRVGVVFQDFALFPHMNVLQNVSFGPRMRGEKKAAAVEKARKGLEMTGMESFARRSPSDLSGGEKQRVALARALAISPDILLLDEPFSALDAALRRSLREEVKKLQRKTGITTVLVTHDQDEALALADILVIMNKGRIIQSGTPSELWHSPSHSFSASFLGRSLKLNVLDIQQLSGSRFLISTSAGEIVIYRNSLQEGFSKPPSLPALLAIRPEEMEIHPQGELSGNVVSSEYTGNAWSVKLQPLNGSLSDGEMEINWPDTDPPADGSTVRLRLRPNGRASLLAQ